MEDVLELYAEPYQPEYPTICIDEAGKELVEQIRAPQPMQVGKVARQDYEYKHNGACNLFIVYEPHQGYRIVEVTSQRTAQDFAHLLQRLVDGKYVGAKKIRIVCDNLNIHAISSLYATFAPAEARRIASKLEFHYTPKHASWLNMVEIEIGVLRSQCLERRIGEQAEVASEAGAWEAERNAACVRIKWQFSCEKARVKLHKLYPQVEAVAEPTLPAVTQLIA